MEDEIFYIRLWRKPALSRKDGLHCTRLYEIYVKGPVNLDHEIFGKIEHLLGLDGVAFQDCIGGREPRDYHLDWWSRPRREAIINQ